MGMVFLILLCTVWLYGVSQGFCDSAFYLSLYLSSDPPLDAQSASYLIFQLWSCPHSHPSSLSFLMLEVKRKSYSVPPLLRSFPSCSWASRYSSVSFVWLFLKPSLVCPLLTSPSRLSLSLPSCSIFSQMTQLPGLWASPAFELLLCPAWLLRAQRRPGAQQRLSVYRGAPMGWHRANALSQCDIRVS